MTLKNSCFKRNSDWLTSQRQTEFVQDKIWFDLQRDPWPKNSGCVECNVEFDSVCTAADHVSAD